MEKRVLVSAFGVGMSLMLWTIHVVPAMAWEGAQDNKQIAELKLMIDSELSSELYEVCLRVGSAKKQADQLAKEFPQARLARQVAEEKTKAMALAGQGSDYANLIRRVWRSKHGAVPVWLSHMWQATSETDRAKCIAAHEEYMQTLTGTRPQPPGRK
jgi:hypothetical protein